MASGEIRPQDIRSTSRWIAPRWTKSSPLTVALALKDGGSPTLAGATFSVRTTHGGFSAFLQRYPADWLSSEWYLLTGVFDPPPEALTYPWGYLGLLGIAATASTATVILAATRLLRTPNATALRES